MTTKGGVPQRLVSGDLSVLHLFVLLLWMLSKGQCVLTSSGNIADTKNGGGRSLQLLHVNGFRLLSSLL